MKNSNYIVYVVVLFLSFSFGCGPEEVFNEIGNYKDGKKDGKWISYWDMNGQKKEDQTYKDGKRDGLWISWYENGNKAEEGTFKDGKFISTKSWDEDGYLRPVIERQLTDSEKSLLEQTIPGWKKKMGMD